MPFLFMIKPYRYPPCSADDALPSIQSENLSISEKSLKKALDLNPMM